jgi:hypothetical protein
MRITVAFRTITATGIADPLKRRQKRTARETMPGAGRRPEGGAATEFRRAHEMSGQVSSNFDHAADERNRR